MGWFFEEKGGYQRINTPTHKGKQTTTDKEVDWRYRISNDKSREIINTLPIRTFCQRHHIKYLGHICRLGNRAMQKQLLFDTRTQDKVSKKMEKLLGVDRAQVRRGMMTKTDLMRLVDVNLNPPGAPQGQTRAQREIR